jgi:hypothetical protein
MVICFLNCLLTAGFRKRMNSQRVNLFHPLNDCSFVAVASSSTAVLLATLAEAISNDLSLYSGIAASQGDSRNALLFACRRMQISHNENYSSRDPHVLLLRLNQAVFAIISFRKIAADTYLQELMQKILLSSNFEARRPHESYI